LSGISEFILIANSLGSLTKFFIQRFDSQAKKLADNIEKFREETLDQLERMDSKESRLYKHARAAADRIEDLVAMKDVAKSLEKTDTIDNLKEFYEHYCQRIFFLRNLDVDYVMLATNFGLEHDFRNKIGFELWDYYSDAALMGILVIEESEKYIKNDDGDIDYDSYVVFQAILNLVDSFVEEAARVAEGHTDRKDEHTKYIRKLRHIVDFHLVRGLDRMGMLSFREGYFGYSARSFSRAIQVIERVLKYEKDQNLQNYYLNQKLLFSAYVDLAVALAWLEKFRSGLLNLRSSLTPTDLKGRFRTDVLDFLGRGGEYSVDTIRKRTKNDLKFIEQLFKQFGTKPQDNPENLGEVDLDRFEKDVALPDIYWQPPRIS